MAFTLIKPGTVTKARDVWRSFVQQAGSNVILKSADETVSLDVKAWRARPKITGLFDRTEQSYDQEKYVVIVEDTALTVNDVVHAPEKFQRVRWDNEDHIVLSVTKFELDNVVIGYKFLCKG